ncbi:MAG: cell division ATP-binding protein FtsE [Candidatus Riflebacteria bacterium RBG_13_59_9]|nr:MAG: cell division ATP-binding protein FtsE [Candidatus Riflebacteria bacterium RBG_13_59_9]
MIKFVDLALTYSGCVALRGISLHIQKQDFVFIVGSTGGGKSSVLKCIYRDVVPQSGKVFVFKKDVTKMPAREIPFLRRRIGVIFQDFLLLPQKTVHGNVSYALEVRGAPTKVVRQLVPEVLDWVGLSRKLKSYPDELSGGEMQRVCIARALVNKPDIRLADEPTGNLDPETSVDILELLKRVNARGTTLLVATHDENIVNHFRTRTIRIEQGRVVSDRDEGGY